MAYAARRDGDTLTIPRRFCGPPTSGNGGYLAGRLAGLGRMTASVDALPYAGDECVVTGRLLGVAGRKSYTATTLYDGDGRVLGRAHAVWIAVDPGRFSS